MRVGVKMSVCTKKKHGRERREEPSEKTTLKKKLEGPQMMKKEEGEKLLKYPF